MFIVMKGMRLSEVAVIIYVYCYKGHAIEWGDPFRLFFPPFPFLPFLSFPPFPFLSFPLGNLLQLLHLNSIIPPLFSSLLLICFVYSCYQLYFNLISTALSQQCHNTVTALSQQCHNTVTTLSQHCHNNVTTLSQQCHNNVTTLSQHCHNNVTTLSQHCHNNVTTMSQHCHNNVTFTLISHY